MGIIKDNYTVKQLAQMAGVSVRTLHYYDQVGLLQPSVRTEANYRLYGAAELLRLQQILFYRELELPLQQIAGILDDPDFDVLEALRQHKEQMQLKRERMSLLLSTIDKTILQLKGNNVMQSNDELYAGFGKEVAGYRAEAIEKYGAEAVTRSENSLKQMTKEELQNLNTVRDDINRQLLQMMDKPANDPQVQEQVKRHYELTRTFWGTATLPDPQKEAYAGLAELYLNDERYTKVDGKYDAAFASFLAEAMKVFAGTL